MANYESILAHLGIRPAPFQLETFAQINSGASGILVAPTGSGKTIAVGLPMLEREKEWKPGNGVRVLWITPLRALAKDSAESLRRIIRACGSKLTVDIRTGDVSYHRRRKQLRSMPGVLVTTPESLHVLISQPEAKETLLSVRSVVLDEWHELISSKRGTQAELGLSYLRGITPDLQVWGVSATLADTEHAAEVLVPSGARSVVVGQVERKVSVQPVLPGSPSRFPWSGHLGVTSAPRVADIIQRHDSTLVFTNTRAQCELWYQALLEADPDLAGMIATHHGSLDQKTRTWVEDAIGEGRLKAVVCTSSLDLGVDFSPVDAVVQIGSPKGIGRFLQRAGRSGHSPGRTSTIYFVPTNSLELLDLEVLRHVTPESPLEPRSARRKPLDVLVQWLVTRACGDGCSIAEVEAEVRRTWAYAELTPKEWEWALTFVSQGGQSLSSYEEYRKVLIDGERIRIASPVLERRHRAAIGTISSDPVLTVKYARGGTLGFVEENFVSKLKPGDTFWLGGRLVEFIQMREVTVFVRRSKRTSGVTPRWNGGRLSLSSEYAHELRAVVSTSKVSPSAALAPLLQVQSRWSLIPSRDELLVEEITSRHGFHVCVFPIAGRAVHEAMAMLVSQRLTSTTALTISLAMNDLGFELYSKEPFQYAEKLSELLSPCNAASDLSSALNATQVARRHFKEIARISGLTCAGLPGRAKRDKHLIASAGLIFDVLNRYEPSSLLLKQTYEEAVEQDLVLPQLLESLRSIERQRIIVKKLNRFTPFSFPLAVDLLRDRMSSEKLEARISRMIKELERQVEKEERKR